MGPHVTSNIDDISHDQTTETHLHGRHWS